MPLTSKDLLTHRKPQQQQLQPRNAGDNDQHGGGGRGPSCKNTNFYGLPRRPPPKNEEGILVSPLLSGGGGGGGKRKFKSGSRRRGPLPFMAELFSYLNVAETAAAMGGDELLHSGKIIEERGTEASSLAQVLG